jgi:RNA polymerase sigma-70 factor (ECF subfamily)
MHTTWGATAQDRGADRREFEALFTRSYRRAYNMAYHMLGNVSESEDATQEAYLRAWQHFDRYDRSRPFEPWLLRILTNVVIDDRRRRKRVTVLSLDAPVGYDAEGAPLSFELTDPSGDPETLLLQGEFGETVQQALAILPDFYRAAILLVDVEGRTYEKTADIMGCSLGTVRSRIHRGRRMLRRLLEQSGCRPPTFLRGCEADTLVERVCKHTRSGPR